MTVERIAFYRSSSGFINGQNLQELWEDLIAGRDVFFEFQAPTGYRDVHRNGTIGRVKLNLDLNAVFFKPHDSYRYGPLPDKDIQEVKDLHALGKLSFKNVTINPYYKTPYVPSITLTFDDRRNTLKPDSASLVWLKGYQGPTLWVNNKPIQKQVEVFDRLGEKLKVGDFCSYILYHYQYSGAATYFGKITKITPSGKVFATNMSLKGEATAEKQVKEPGQIVLLSKDLLDRLMLMKLSS